MIESMKKFTDITDFSREGLREMLNLVSFLKDNSDPYKSTCAGKTVVTLFENGDENARLAVSAAAARMGGSVFDFNAPAGQSLKDTVLAASSCGDALVLNHKKKGAARAASLYSRIPVINAGDGGRAFPVRTLSDFSTVWIEKHHISNMKIGFLGDFSDNALARGLLQCLNLYNGNEFFFISVNGKPVSDDYINIMDRREKPFVVYDNLFDILPELDVLYMTKVEAEHFQSAIALESRRHKFVLDERMMLAAKPELAVLHSLPRGLETDISIDNDSRARYFEQNDIFVYANMAILIKTLTGRSGRLIKPEMPEATHPFSCRCPDCITSTEPYLPALFHETDEDTLICKYCGTRYKRSELSDE